MNKKELVSAVADESNVNLSQDDANRVVDTVFKVIMNALSNNDEVVLVGFGKFSVTDRAATTGRNPSTNEAIDIAAKRVPRFKAGKTLKDAVNKSGAVNKSNTKTKK